jgi:hypothetical protein
VAGAGRAGGDGALRGRGGPEWRRAERRQPGATPAAHRGGRATNGPGRARRRRAGGATRQLGSTTRRPGGGGGENRSGGGGGSSKFQSFVHVCQVRNHTFIT